MSRAQNWAVLLYPDDETHANALARLQMLDVNFAGILHDKDVYDDDDMTLGHVKGEKKKPHFHIVLSYEYQRSHKSVADTLGIDGRFIKPIGRTEGAVFPDRKSALGYLVHLGTSGYQYSRDELFGPLAPAVPMACDDKPDENALVKQLVDLIDTLPVPCTYKKMVIASCNAGLYPVLRRLGYLSGKLLDEHNDNGKHYDW